MNKSSAMALQGGCRNEGQDPGSGNDPVAMLCVNPGEGEIGDMAFLACVSAYNTGGRGVHVCLERRILIFGLGKKG